MPNKVGWCKGTEKVILDQLAERLQKKRNVIAELNSRIKEWNSLQCRQCGTDLRGIGPETLDRNEMRRYENRNASEDVEGVSRDLDSDSGSAALTEASTPANMSLG